MNEDIENKLHSLKDEAPKTEGSYSFFEKNAKARTNNRSSLRRKKKLITMTVVFSSIASLLVLFVGRTFFEVKTERKDLSRRFSYSQVKLAMNDTFKRLNDFAYPEGGEIQKVSSQYEKAMNDFAYDLYSNTNLGSNGIINPFTAYLQMDLLSHGVSNPSLAEAFDSVLHLSSSERDENFNKAFLTNRDPGSVNTSHIESYNAAFLDCKYVFQTSYLNYLTSKYCEAYSLDITNERDVKLMANWANQRADETSISPSDFELTNYTSMVFLSTMNFKGKWGFNKADTRDMTFYTSDGKESIVPGMNHSYFGRAYQYDGYWSFNMTFYGGYTIQFLTPDKREGDIHKLLKGKNFLTEDEDKLFIPKSHRGNLDDISYMIEVTLPRFKASNKISLDEAYNALGLSSIYERTMSLGNMIEEKEPVSGEDLLVWVEKSKQSNAVSWDEDGVEASTIEMKTFGAGTTAYEYADGIAFTFDSPFVYVIRDRNNLPIYIGNVDEVSK